MYRNEVHTVSGHGSLILSTPLRHSHEIGAGVFMYQGQRDHNQEEWWYGEDDDEELEDSNEIQIHIGSTPNHSDYDESDTSGGTNGMGGLQHHLGAVPRPFSWRGSWRNGRGREN